MEPDVIAAWAREVAEEWRWLFAQGSLHSLSPATFTETVYESEPLWIVLFTDGLECGPCKTAQTNMLRLSAGLKDAVDDAVAVGIVNCELPESQVRMRL